MIFLTDDKATHDFLVKNKKESYLITTSYGVNIDSAGKVIRTLDINGQKKDICLSEYGSSSKEPLEKALVHRNKITLINAYKATQQSQYYFDMLITQLKNNESIGQVKRFWTNSKDELSQLLNLDISSLSDNSDYKNISHFYFLSKLLDNIWSEEPYISHSNLKMTLQQYYIMSLVYDRTNNIKSIQQQAFFTVNAVLDSFIGGKVVGKIRYKGKYKHKTIDEAKKIQKIADTDFVVYTSKLVERTTPKQLLYTTPTLIKALGHVENIDEVLRNLFSKGYITNPSTNTHYISSSMVPQIISSLSHFDHHFSIYTDFININGLKGNDLKDHIIATYVNDEIVESDHTHAIIPLPGKNVNTLSNRELYVYEMIVKRYFSIFLQSPKKYKFQIVGYNADKVQITIERDSYLKYGSDIFELRKDHLFEELDINTTSLRSMYDIGSVIQNKDISLEVKGNISRVKKPYTGKQLMTKLLSMGKKTLARHLMTKHRHFYVGDSTKWMSYIERLVIDGLLYLDDQKRYNLTNDGFNFINNSKANLISTDNLNNIYINLINVLVGRRRLMDTLEEHLLFLNKLKHGPSFYEVAPANYKYIVNNFNCICGGDLREHENFIGCSTYPQCRFSLSKSIRSGDVYRLSETDIIELLTDGETTSVIKDFTFKSGKKRNITFKLGKNNRIEYVFHRKSTR